jgi:hypothetical protein
METESLRQSERQTDKEGGEWRMEMPTDNTNTHTHTHWKRETVRETDTQKEG